MYFKPVFSLFTWVNEKKAFTFTMRDVDLSLLAYMPGPHPVRYRLKATIFLIYRHGASLARREMGNEWNMLGLCLLGSFVISYETAPVNSVTVREAEIDTSFPVHHSLACPKPLVYNVS